MDKDTRKDAFMETLRSVAEIAKTSELPLSKDEIAGYFQDMDLSKEQQELIYQYLLQPQEDAQEADDDEEQADQETEVELPKTVFFQMYLEDLQGVRPCPPQEEAALYKSLAAGDDTAVQKLSEQWLAKVLHLARIHAPSSEELADVVQEGNMGVFLALGSLLGSGREMEPDAYQKMLTDAAEEAMEAYLSDARAAEDMEQSVLAKAALVHEAQKFLAEEFQRMPTTAELSQYTRLSEQELEDILAMSKEK